MITGHHTSITVMEHVSDARARAGQCFDARCECGWHYGSATRLSAGHAAFVHLENIEAATLPKPRHWSWQYGS